MKTTFREAMRAALREALSRDERVFLMGEDVGRYGGCFGRQPRPARGVRPRAHARHAAVRVGVRGRRHRRGARRPAADRRDHDRQLQPARPRPDPQQRRHPARTCPADSSRPAGHPHPHRRRPPARRPALAQPRGLVRPHPRPPGPRACHGRGRRAACSSTALADPDPVLVFEHVSLYGIEGELPTTPDRRHRPGRASAARAATSRSSPTAARSAGARRPPTALAADGIDAEVIDLRMLRPLDMATVLESVARTHRPVVVDEAWRTGGLAAEVVPASPRRPSTTSTRRSSGSAAPRCRSRTPSTSRRPRCRRSPTIVAAAAAATGG